MRSSRSSVIQDCELLPEGEDLKLQGCLASNRSSQGMEQGNEDGSHAGHVTPECPRRSTISRPTASSIATGLIGVVNLVRMTFMKTTVSAAEAKAHFAECLRAVEQGRPVVITRHGKAVAALVPAEEAAQLRRLQAAGPRGGLAGIAGGWKGAGDLVKQVARIRRARPRKMARLASA